ncbi:AraC family transcriptional regulator [Spirosoma radiotolerans]|uniref:HTH araC/xylS-type domain-containing protein n=1 Tax=Spirosoma radiotolerans TaxID=1379870 RepID=A0A0E3ZX87_9BACT|nr:AraC family transcriptional regulator [Spirosoma radiotolerans]AKD56250.1 hypothetical protein SD10_16430 [Spirosoma radiotolerans]
MKRCIQHEPIRIQQAEINQWALPIHTHNHFELIYIRDGSGYHIINGHRHPYQSGDVFFLGPSDNHFFDISTRTTFGFLSFTELYLADLTESAGRSWTPRHEQQLPAFYGLVGSIYMDATDRQHLNALFEILLIEQINHQEVAFSLICKSLVMAILNLIERQFTRHQVKLAKSGSSTSDLVQRMFLYICQHIQQPDQLRMDRLADVFHYSPRHLSTLFKQQVGESLQEYIIRYKLKLVEKQLHLNTLTISQIADELGFTDVCHLNKLFKRYYQHTPTDYRRSLSTTISQATA